MTSSRNWAYYSEPLRIDVGGVDVAEGEPVVFSTRGSDQEVATLL